MTTLEACCGIGAILVALCGSIGVLYIVTSRCGLSSETTRKTVHVVMGVVSMTFPWVFESTWPVAVLGVSSFVVMLVLRWVPALSHTAGLVIRGVGRKSIGDLCFPVAVPILFLITQGNPLLYCLPLIYLTFGDTAAVKIGKRYGTSHFKVPGGRKSLEGSLAFFVVGLVGTSIPVAMFCPVSPLQVIAIALVMAIAVTLIEAVSTRGLDNLSIPLGSFLLLHALLGGIST